MISDASLKMIFVYAAYGRSMMAAHQLEQNLLAIVSSHPEKLPEKYTAEKVRKMTLGSLVNIFINCYSPPEELVEELDNMIYFRNELAHRISNFIVSTASSHKWHDEVISELAEIESFFEETNELLSPYIEACYKKLNISKEKMNEIAFSLYPHLKRND